MKNNFEIKFLNFIKTEKLITPGDSVLVAYSGGIDSGCLLYLLNKFKNNIKIKLAAFYLNHLIRSEIEIEAEIELIRRICTNYDIPFKTAKADIIKTAKEHGLSIEDTARRIRYRLLHETAVSLDCNKIAVAHHLDDSAETIILKIIKGASPSSTGGIAPALKKIIRPLMFASKAGIEAYAALKNIDFSIDSTNAEEKYERNFVRTKIMPLIKEINHNFTTAVSNFYEIQKHENDLLNSLALDFYEKHCIYEKNGQAPPRIIISSAGQFTGLHIALKRRLILYISSLINPENENGETRIGLGAITSALNFIDNITKESIEIIKGRLYIYRQFHFDPAHKYANGGAIKLIFTAAPPEERFGVKNGFYPLKLKPGGDLTLKCGGFLYKFQLKKISEKEFRIGKDFTDKTKCDSDGREAVFNFKFQATAPIKDEIELTIKPFSPGDRIKPYSMKGRSQKISDLLTNEKLYGPLKKFIPVIYAADGEILAVCNIKLSEYCKIGYINQTENNGFYLFSSFTKEIL